LEQDNEVVFESMRYPNADIFNAFTEVMRGRSNKFTEAYPYQLTKQLSLDPCQNNVPLKNYAYS
jgi:hypothetical protein